MSTFQTDGRGNLFHYRGKPDSWKLPILVLDSIETTRKGQKVLGLETGLCLTIVICGF